MVKMLSAIFEEEIIFTYKYAPEIFKEDMEGLFVKTRGFTFIPNITGQFLPPDQFIIYPKITLNGGGCTMRGKLVTEDGKTIIRTRLYADRIIVYLFWSSFLFGLVFFLNYIFSSHNKKDQAMGFYFSVAAPVLLFLLSKLTRLFFKRSFTKYFKLAG
jgi:hypothetical protein